MAFESTELEAIFAEIRRRQAEVGRLSLVEFGDTEYATLLDWAQRIVRDYRSWWWSLEKREHGRLVFLAFTMAFVRRHKYTDDNVFWPDFERVLDLRPMERRFLAMDDLLWPAYREEGLDLSFDGRGRRIVGTLADEMRQARTWVTQARDQFVRFFKWYYRHCPQEEITPELIETYQKQTGIQLLVLGKVLPALTRDCQTLARVIDFAIENGLYLQASHFEHYRHQIVDTLGPEYDPARLGLIRDQRTLVRLILELQNHRTPAQFEQELRARRGAVVTMPWGKPLDVRTALERWTPFPYGIYSVEGQEYRVVPHPRLRLEMLDGWPFERVVHWQSGRFLGYKKLTPFQVTVGRRVLEATPYWWSRGEHVCVWVGQVPIGEKLDIDGRLCPDSAGADWRVNLRLTYQAGGRPALCAAVDRLVLYYPDLTHRPMSIWTSTGYAYTDSLREDGVRRFHRHGALVISLEAFEAPFQIGVTVDDNSVLSRTFEPEPAYLFSAATRERVQARGQAEVGDREYVLFTRDNSFPQASPSVSVVRLPEPYGSYAVYQVTWADANQPFELQLRSAQWSFQRRREFTPLLGSSPSPPYLRLKPHQFQRFIDVTLRLYSTLDLTTSLVTLEVWDESGQLASFGLGDYVQQTATPNLYDVHETLWQEINQLTGDNWGRYTLLFVQGETTLAELDLSVIPPIRLKWDAEAVYPESELIPISVVTPHPAWNPMTGKAETRVQLTVRPKTQAEPWSEHPKRRRLVPEPVSAPLIFPNLGESVDIVVRPQLFGMRLYLKHTGQTAPGQWRTAYQPVEQADYYHLNQTALYLFSAPETYVEINCGALVVWAGQTDANGDLFTEDLSALYDACLSEHTEFTARSGGLQTSFVVRWTPLLYEMCLEDETLAVRFHGPEDTDLRLNLRDRWGSVSHTWQVDCPGHETNVTLPLPTGYLGPGYITAEYILSDGQTRPAAQQIYVPGKGVATIPLSWLEEGIGVVEEQEMSLLFGLELG